MANTFDWVEIRTRDINRSAAFYEALFGWKVVEKQTAEGSDYWIFDTGCTPRLQSIQKGGLWQRPAGKPTGVATYVLVENIEVVTKKVSRLGGRVVTPSTLQGQSRRACISDLDGNMIGL